MNPSTPIETLLKQLDKRKNEKPKKIKLLMTQLVRWGYVNIKSIGGFDKDCGILKKKATAEKCELYLSRG